MKPAPLIRDWRDALLFAAQSVAVAAVLYGWIAAGPLILEILTEAAR